MRRNRIFKHFNIFTLLVLFITSWYFIIAVDGASFFELFSQKNLEHLQTFIGKLFGEGTENPAFLDPDSWKNALELTFETLQMSVLAIGLSTIFMFLTVIPAAYTAANGTLLLRKKWYGWIAYGIIRFFYILSRAIPELVWAMIVIFMFNPGILPGAMALFLHNVGILGKLCAEVLENMNLRPIHNLAASGAGKVQILFYGVIPTVLPQFITYILYRWEIIIRTTVVVGVVGAGGLGQQFKLSMSYFDYTNITLLLICYLGLVFFVDLFSGVIRRVVK